MLIADTAFVLGFKSHSASLELDCPAEDAFALLCAVEKWPVWLSFLRSARRQSSQSELNVGSEVVIRSCLPGDEEQLFEVDAFIANYRLSLVGANFRCGGVSISESSAGPRVQNSTCCSRIPPITENSAAPGSLATRAALLERASTTRWFTSRGSSSMNAMRRSGGFLEGKQPSWQSLTMSAKTGIL